MNKSSSYSYIAITVQAIEGSFVTYTLTHASSGQRAFRWQARTGNDRMVAAALVPGKSYHVDVSTDDHGVQHWTSAREVVSASRAEQRKQNKAAAKRNPIMDYLQF